MTVLEKAVRNLAEAIESLESRLEARLDEAAASEETVAAARRQAQAARKQTDSASRGIAAAITDLKAILADDDQKRDKKYAEKEREKEPYNISDINSKQGQMSTMRRMSNRTMHGFTGLAMRIRRVFWRFRRRSFSTSSSISRPTVLFFYFVIYFFSICFNLLQSPTTIVAPTGPVTNTGENILYTTSSRIAEILPFRDSVFIICCDGMMKEIKFNPDATKVFIVSEFQLQIPLHPNQPDSVLVNACQINHAIFDHVSRTFYFNLKR